jgi:hypothetical protein
MRESAPFSAFAETLERVRGTSSKKAKVGAFAIQLITLSAEDAGTAARLATGRPSARGSKDEVQVGYSTLLEVIQEICNATRDETSRIYLR